LCFDLGCPAGTGFGDQCVNAPIVEKVYPQANHTVAAVVKLTDHFSVHPQIEGPDGRNPDKTPEVWRAFSGDQEFWFSRIFELNMYLCPAQAIPEKKFPEFGPAQNAFCVKKVGRSI